MFYFELINWLQICILVTGYAEFANTTIQVYENESSIEVCVRARGYGFVVNVSTAELTATGTLYAHHRLVNLGTAPVVTVQFSSSVNGLPTTNTRGS